MQQQRLIFETELGWIGLAWTAQGFTRLFMPQASRDAVAERAMRDAPDAEPVDVEATPAFVRAAVEALKAYAQGAEVDFSATPVSFGEVGEMRAAIYAALRRVPYGRTLTYGELAEEAGFAGMAREIGQAMGQNPVPIIVPCHRVVAASGKLGGFSAPGGARTKERLLVIERARPLKERTAQASFSF